MFTYSNSTLTQPIELVFRDVKNKFLLILENFITWRDGTRAVNMLMLTPSRTRVHFLFVYHHRRAAEKCVIQAKATLKVEYEGASDSLCRPKQAQIEINFEDFSANHD